MELMLASLKVLIGTFTLFTVARVSYASIGQHSGWAWVAFVGVLAIANMLVHRLLGSTINPPFFTALWFAMTLAGLTPKDSPKVTTWFRRAIYAVAVGTLIGWFLYVEVHHVR